MNDINFFKDDLAQENKRFTVFAPINSAFDNLPRTERQRYVTVSQSQSAKNDLDDILKYHTALRYNLINEQYLIYRDDEMGNQVAISALEATKRLFFNTVDGKYYVNGARLIEGKTNLIADNGIIHIVDTFLHVLPIAETALSYITGNGAQSQHDVTFDLFQEFLTRYEALINLDKPALDALSQGFVPVTIFVPSDDVILSLNQNRINEAKRDNQLLKQIVEAHVIRGVAYHGNILIDKAMSGATVPAMDGDIEPRFFSNNLEVSNQCARGRVTHANITVFNGVVHVIDGLLGYVYNNIYNELLEDQDLDDFSALVFGIESVVEDINLPSSSTPPLRENMITVFAPVDGMGDISDTTPEIFHSYENQERAVFMHMIRGRIDVSQMNNGTSFDTFDENHKAYFYRLPEGGVFHTYVEVNEVRARILVGDVCALNGVVHKIDHVLGFPSALIWDEIRDNNDFTSLQSVIRVTGLDQSFQNKQLQLTFFAPTDYAFELMQQDRQGVKLLDRDNSDHLTNVMNRHLLKGAVTLPQSGNRDFTTEFRDEKITVSRDDAGAYTVQFRGLRVPVLRANMRMRNGMMHVIDGVLYSDDPNASEWTSTASHLTSAPLISLIVLTICACVLR